MSASDVGDLVAGHRHRRAQSTGLAGTPDHRNRLRVGAVPALHRLQPSLHVDRGPRGQRDHQHRPGPFPSPHFRPGARRVRLPLVPGERTRPHSLVRLGARRARRGSLPLPAGLQGRHRAPGRRLRSERHRRGLYRHGGAGHRRLPHPRPAPGGGCERLRVLRVLRAPGVAPGCDPVERRLDRQGDVALLDADRGGLRGRDRRVGVAHLPVRPLRRHSREGGRGQLLHEGRLLPARPLPGRARQGGGGRLGHERHLLRLIGGEHGDHRHFHHPPDEAHGLQPGEGRRGGSRFIDERTAHSPGDGGGRVPDIGVHRRQLRRDHQARRGAGDRLLHRARLHRAPGSAEARPEGSPEAALVTRVRHQGDGIPRGFHRSRSIRRPGVLRAGLAEGRRSRLRLLRRDPALRAPVPGAPHVRVAHSGPRSRCARRTDHRAASRRPHRGERPALPAADRHPDVVHPGGTPLARAVGVLGRGRDAGGGAHPAPAQGPSQGPAAISRPRAAAEPTSASTA